MQIMAIATLMATLAVAVVAISAAVLFDVAISAAVLFGRQGNYDRCREALERDGYCILSNVFDTDLVAEMESTAVRLATEQDADAARRQQYTGSLISLTSAPVYARMLVSTTVQAAFKAMGGPYSSSRFMNGYVISKPGRGKRLYWHQDWWGWDHVASYGTIPPMFALMTYLTETRAPNATDPGNGCLRVIPGSHRRRHALHNRVPDAHGDEVSFGGLEGPAFDEDVADAVDVPMRPGDAVLVDVRLLHATRDNLSDERRSMITCWWVPGMGMGASDGPRYSIPAAWRAEFAAQVTDNPHDKGASAWSASEKAAVRQLSCQHLDRDDDDLGRYHGGPSGQPHQPGAGPGFEVTADDVADERFRYFGSGRAALVEVGS